MAKWRYFNLTNWNFLFPKTPASLVRYVEAEIQKNPNISRSVRAGIDDFYFKSTEGLIVENWPRSGRIRLQFGKVPEANIASTGERMKVQQQMGVMLILRDEETHTRELFTSGLWYVGKRAPDLRNSYQIYIHRFLDESLPDGANQYVYVGITRRSWKQRLKEHQWAARNGSPYIFHARMRDAWQKKWLSSHHVMHAGLSKEEAMRFEEWHVEKYALYPDNPRGMNMIPGGYAGITALHRLGALSEKALVAPDSRPKIISHHLREHSRKGVPNPLIAALWKDENYAAAVICGPARRFNIEQVREIRKFRANGVSASEIADRIGARNVDQVRRVLSGKTYSRVR